MLVQRGHIIDVAFLVEGACQVGSIFGDGEIRFTCPGFLTLLGARLARKFALQEQEENDIYSVPISNGINAVLPPASLRSAACWELADVANGENVSAPAGLAE